MPNDGPIDRDALLRQEEAGWDALMAAVQRVPGEHRSEPGVVPGWSVKDLLWHCGRWAAWVSEPLARVQDGSYVADRSYPWEQMNQDWADESKPLDWDDVERGAASMREEALEALRALPQLDAEAAKEFTSETVEHYAEHAAEIARFADVQG